MKLTSLTVSCFVSFVALTQQITKCNANEAKTSNLRTKNSRSLLSTKEEAEATAKAAEDGGRQLAVACAPDEYALEIDIKPPSATPITECVHRHDEPSCGVQPEAGYKIKNLCSGTTVSEVTFTPNINHQVCVSKFSKFELTVTTSVKIGGSHSVKKSGQELLPQTTPWGWTTTYTFGSNDCKCSSNAWWFVRWC